jgi:hypothetical protein
MISAIPTVAHMLFSYCWTSGASLSCAAGVVSASTQTRTTVSIIVLIWWQVLVGASADMLSGSVPAALASGEAIRVMMERTELNLPQPSTTSSRCNRSASRVSRITTNMGQRERTSQELLRRLTGTSNQPGPRWRCLGGHSISVTTGTGRPGISALVVRRCWSPRARRASNRLTCCMHARLGLRRDPGEAIADALSATTKPNMNRISRLASLLLAARSATPRLGWNVSPG